MDLRNGYTLAREDAQEKKFCPDVTAGHGTANKVGDWQSLLVGHRETFRRRLFAESLAPEAHFLKRIF